MLVMTTSFDLSNLQWGTFSMAFVLVQHGRLALVATVDT